MERAQISDEIRDDHTMHSSLRKTFLEHKYNIKFSLLCQLFENSIKAKTKSKVK